MAKIANREQAAVVEAGTVFVDGERLVAGTTDNAELESLEDTNTTTT